MNGVLPGFRAIHFASSLLLFGGLLFGLLVLAPAGREGTASKQRICVRHRLDRIIRAALVVAMLSGTGWLVALTAEIGNTSLRGAVSDGLTWMVLTQTQFGFDWWVRACIGLALAGLLILASIAGSGVMIEGACVFLAAAFLGSLAWAGHAVTTSGLDGQIHLVSDVLHLFGVGGWFGGLWPLAILLMQANRAGDAAALAFAHDSVMRFSRLATLSVAVIVGTGAVNAYELLGIEAFSLDTPYKQLLWTKVGLFAGMLAFAGVNRMRLTPRLAREESRADALRRILRNTSAELVLGILVLAIVAVLGRITPHIHD